MKLEEFIPGVKYHGVSTDKDVTLAGTNTLSGTTNISGSATFSGLTKAPNPVLQQTITDVDAQNATPTIANILGGIVTHNSKTGAGTVTVPTGANMSGGVAGVAIGSTIKWLYYNRGDRTATITAASGHTLVGGTAAVTTGKHSYITSVCTAANTWVSYLSTLM
jgi:hypothetical protein